MCRLEIAAAQARKTFELTLITKNLLEIRRTTFFVIINNKLCIKLADSFSETQTNCVKVVYDPGDKSVDWL